jgi:transglycosylase-like protein with SLT domain/sporulation related protein
MSGTWKEGFAKRLACLTIAVAAFATLLVPSASMAQGTDPSQTGNRSDGTATVGRDRHERSGDDTQDSLCLMVESAARANDLPVDFFARLIWQESRFQSDALGPLTRYGTRAQGIAQFMPSTAREHGLLDPLNPVQALPKAAEFLAALRNRFGNLGLAAAAYNAGPRRVREWLGGTGGIPSETRSYVSAITGREIEKWANAANGEEGAAGGEAKIPACHDLVLLLEREPNHFVSQLEQSVARSVTKPWGVQIATGFGRDQAIAMYAQAIKDIKAAVNWKEDDPNIQPMLSHIRGSSSFYQVRIGANTRREAVDLCNRIRLSHAACLVKRRNT